MHSQELTAGPEKIKLWKFLGAFGGFGKVKNYTFFQIDSANSEKYAQVKLDHLPKKPG